MPFEVSGSPGRRIAVIGGGISGLGAAEALAGENRVVVFEAEPRLGGHARTRMAGPNRETAVDTGFIVFNYANYPELARLFDRLDVPVQPASMSFGASIDGGRVEYALQSLSSIFAQKRNLLNPAFLRMIRDILKFNAKGVDLADSPDMTVQDLLDRLGTGPYFRDCYLLPFTGAIWSTPKEQILEFPAQALLRFMKNHALLSAYGQHQWYSVSGGSWQYVSRLQSRLEKLGTEIRTAAAVQAVRRVGGFAEVKTYGGDWETFDEVIFATHSDDSLAMLMDPTPLEQEVLGAIGYQPNDVVLHSDESLMPRRKSVWASWVYTEAKDRTTDRIDMSYWMNSLQRWLTGDNYFVTLNSERPIREELIWDQTTLRHPVYDLAALAAQAKVPQLNGQNSTWYCGAWVKNGFHEDGLSSGLDVARGIRQGSTVLPIAAE